MVEHVLILTVGLPYSGKSTWALQQTHPVVNPDAIRLALHGHRYFADAEPMVWAMAKLMVRALFRAGHPTVILDATSNTRARRDAWIDEAWTIGFYKMETPAPECIQRAIAANDEVILPIIQRMAEEHEPVGDDE